MTIQNDSSFSFKNRDLQATVHSKTEFYRVITVKKYVFLVIFPISNVYNRYALYKHIWKAAPYFATDN